MLMAAELAFRLTSRLIFVDSQDLSRLFFVPCGWAFIFCSRDSCSFSDFTRIRILYLSNRRIFAASHSCFERAGRLTSKERALDQKLANSFNAKEELSQVVRIGSHLSQSPKPARNM